MHMGTPVVAVDSGGPKETVVHEQTGFLCPPVRVKRAVGHVTVGDVFLTGRGLLRDCDIATVKGIHFADGDATGSGGARGGEGVG